MSSKIVPLQDGLRWSLIERPDPTELRSNIASRDTVFNRTIANRARIEVYLNSSFMVHSYGWGRFESDGILIGFWDSAPEHSELPDSTLYRVNSIAVSKRKPLEAFIEDLKRSTSWGYRLRYWAVIHSSDSSFDDWGRFEAILKPALEDCYGVNTEASRALIEQKLSKGWNQKPVGSIGALLMLLSSIARNSSPGLEIAEAVIDLDS